MTAAIFDADELRTKAEAARASRAQGVVVGLTITEFIQAVSPDAVLALLDELKATRAQLADERNKTREAEEDAFFKKDWR